MIMLAAFHEQNLNRVGL